MLSNQLVVLIFFFIFLAIMIKSRIIEEKGSEVYEQNPELTIMIEEGKQLNNLAQTYLFNRTKFPRG